MSRTAAILLAAGRGQRMQGAVADKVLAPVEGRPVFAYSAAAFMESGVADFYVIVYRDSAQMLALSAYAPTPSVHVRGGRERQDSVVQALAALPADIEHVFIHDCARPLIRPEQLVALHKTVRLCDAVVLAHRVTDTIKERKGKVTYTAAAGTGGHLRSLAPSRLRTPDRSLLWAMETPQAFARDLVVRAYARAQAIGRRLTDDAAAVELLRHPVALLENPHPNPKLTTPADLDTIAFLLKKDLHHA
jgi:2-C-methyl-D-erythritol 4-phosphate cytidylyltransferase